MLFKHRVNQVSIRVKFLRSLTVYYEGNGAIHQHSVTLNQNFPSQLQ